MAKPLTYTRLTTLRQTAEQWQAVETWRKLAKLTTGAAQRELITRGLLSRETRSEELRANYLVNKRD